MKIKNFVIKVVMLGGVSLAIGSFTVISTSLANTQAYSNKRVTELARAAIKEENQPSYLPCDVILAENLDEIKIKPLFTGRAFQKLMDELGIVTLADLFTKITPDELAAGFAADPENMRAMLSAYYDIQTRIITRASLKLYKKVAYLCEEPIREGKCALPSLAVILKEHPSLLKIIAAAENNIGLTSDLLAFSSDQILEFQGMGIVRLVELEFLLNSFGLKFKGREIMDNRARRVPQVVKIEEELDDPTLIAGLRKLNVYTIKNLAKITLADLHEAGLDSQDNIISIQNVHYKMGSILVPGSFNIPK